MLSFLLGSPAKAKGVVGALEATHAKRVYWERLSKLLQGFITLVGFRVARRVLQTR